MLRALLDFAFAPMYFSSPKVPAPAPVQVDNSAEVERARIAAERSAMAESKLSGRRATIVGGGLLAAEEQQERGMLSQKKRAAAREVFG
jgi:hypothetical protein